MTVILKGMHGLGDNIHQRAAVRQLMKQHVVYLHTPWPCIYHDLAGPRLHLVPVQTKLRTQAKNAAREAAKFHNGRLPAVRTLQASYSPAGVRETGSVLEALVRSVGCDIRQADFRLPVPQAWRDKAAPWLARWNPTKPLLIYRPLNDRSEWGGCRARNPDHDHYADLIESIRDRFFVLSVADFEPEKEWMVGRPIAADVECHRGELDIETLAALTERAALVFTSPGFMVPLAQAVSTPVVCIFGGYEDSASFSAGAHFAPYLGIDPIKPCTCFSHNHACQKEIDMPLALERLESFVDEVCHERAMESAA